MKNNRLQILLFAALATALSALPGYAMSSTEEVSNIPEIKVDFGETITVATKQNEIKFVLGESEAQKKERKAAEALAKKKSVEKAAQVVATNYSTDLASLRALYQSAAAVYGIDWKLIEAVHQVETGKSAQCKTSYAGATGPMQFMPSTFRAYAQSGGNICDLKDSIYAAANLLARSGAASGDIDSALFSYNHSSAYVQKVKSVMESI